MRRGSGTKAHRTRGEDARRDFVTLAVFAVVIVAGRVAFLLPALRTEQTATA